VTGKGDKLHKGSVGLEPCSPGEEGVMGCTQGRRRCNAAAGAADPGIKRLLPLANATSLEGGNRKGSRCDGSLSAQNPVGGFVERRSTICKAGVLATLNWAIAGRVLAQRWASFDAEAPLPASEGPVPASKGPVECAMPGAAAAGAALGCLLAASSGSRAMASAGLLSPAPAPFEIGGGGIPAIIVIVWMKVWARAECGKIHVLCPPATAGTDTVLRL